MVDNYGEKILKSFVGNCDVFIKFGENDEIGSTKMLGKKTCQNEVEFFKRYDDLKNAARDSAFDEFEDAITELRSQNYELSVEKSTQYKKFIENINNIMKKSNETDANTSLGECFSEISTVRIDPLTKKELVNPVKNRRCNHIYGKDSVMELLQENGRLKCPYVGCNNKQYIKPEDLVEL